MKGLAWKTLAGVALAALLGAGPAGAEAGAMPGVASLKEAQEMAAQRRVPILVDFSAEW